ncbi:MAG: hypothetical protein L0229_18705 [Blastocatellia bacterium]|nr:hypothetical protein [Blastocatellia bacterium]
MLYEAVDLLRASEVMRGENRATFAEFYNAIVDAAHADRFLAAIWDAEDVEAVGRHEQATITRAIRLLFRTEGWLDPAVPDSRLLLMYCLYWWSSFTTGYTFEVAVLKDLERTGLVFQAHDPRNRAERYALADLAIGGFLGDVKSSTYFLFVTRSYPLRHDFYITRLWDARERRYQRVVILSPKMWAAVNGETVTCEFAQLLEVIGQPARFDFAGQSLIALGYAEWVDKMTRYQQTGGIRRGIQTD